MSERILIVDDEDALRENVSEFLRLKGYAQNSPNFGIEIQNNFGIANHSFLE